LTGGRVRVVVATTEGPSTVLRVTAEDPAVRSVVCLGRSATALPISRAYDAFVRAPTGIVERAVGHRAFRLDVSAPIDDGDSWQLGLYLAHRLKAVGRLAEDDGPADLVVWATGAVDADLAVRKVERVAEKRRRSESLFVESGRRLLLAVPAGQAEALGAPPPGGEVMALDSVRPLLARLGLERSAPDPVRPVRRRWPGRMTGIGLLIALAAAAIGLSELWSTPPDTPPGTLPGTPSGSAVPVLLGPTAVPPAIFDPAAVRLDVLERRPAGDGPCGGDERTEAVEPGAATPPGVCGLTVRATNGGAAPGFIWLLAVAEGTFREYAGSARAIELAEGPLAAGETAEARVIAPAWVRRPVVFRVLLVLAAAERPEVSAALAGVDTLSSDDLDRLAERFIDLGLEVRLLRHRVQPRP